MKSVIFVLTFAVFFAASSAAQLYKWVDKNGVTQYADTPPPADARDVQRKRLGDNKIETDKVSFSVRAAVENNPVVLYASNCGSACDDARAFLTKRGIPFTTRDPSTDPAAADALKKLVGGSDIPTLAVGDQSVKGFADVLWNSALDAGGYPRSIPNRGQTPPAPPVPPAPTPEPSK